MNHLSNLRLTTIVILALSAGSIAAENSSITNELGLKVGQRYIEAKAHLLKNGWRVDTSYGNPDEKPPYGFTEVVCGIGKMAVCSARFLKKNREIMITLKPKNKLVVEGAWNDK